MPEQSRYSAYYDDYDGHSENHGPSDGDDGDEGDTEPLISRQSSKYTTNTDNLVDRDDLDAVNTTYTLVKDLRKQDPGADGRYATSEKVVTAVETLLGRLAKKVTDSAPGLSGTAATSTMDYDHAVYVWERRWAVAAQSLRTLSDKAGASAKILETISTLASTSSCVPYFGGRRIESKISKEYEALSSIHRDIAAQVRQLTDAMKHIRQANEIILSAGE
jgi:hypothetical protein